MVKRGGGDLLVRLGPDLSAVVLRNLDDPADLVRSASVSQSWRRFVITNGFSKKLCLRTIPEISCFIRSIEVGGLPDIMEVLPNCSSQWKTLESKHRIYAYLGHRIVSPRFLTQITVEPIAASTITERIENMLPNGMGPNMFSSYWSSVGKSSLTFRLSCKFCVVHEIKIQLLQEILHFRLVHMRDENENREESLVGNFIWTYVSPEFSMMEADSFQSLKLQRPFICFDGILQIELLCRDTTSEFPDISASQVKAIVCPLAPAFDVSPLDRMGNSILMYFPGAVEYLDDAQQPFCASRRKLWMKTRRRRKNH